MSEVEAERSDKSLPYCVVNKRIWAANGNKIEEEGDKRKAVTSDYKHNSTDTLAVWHLHLKHYVKYKSPVSGV